MGGGESALAHSSSGLVLVPWILLMVWGHMYGLYARRVLDSPREVSVEEPAYQGRAPAPRALHVCP